jgi:hypothetical protein
VSAQAASTSDAAVSHGDPALVELRPVGTGRPLVRALARMIVRRELIFARLIPDPEGCFTDDEAG